MLRNCSQLAELSNHALVRPLYRPSESDLSDLFKQSSALSQVVRLEAPELHELAFDLYEIDWYDTLLSREEALLPSHFRCLYPADQARLSH